MNSVRMTINEEARASLLWLAGFVEMGTPQSSARLGAIAYTAASIVYAYQPNPDHFVLGELLSAAALFCGLRKSTTETPS
jgi:hypothetical protein